MLSNVLKLIITGQGHSGTTISKRVFEQSRFLADIGGIECGVFNLFYDQMPQWPHEKIIETLSHWGLTSDTLTFMIENFSTYETFYQDLRFNSSLITDNCLGIIDKTPAYIRHLPHLLSIAADIPIIIMRKDPKNFVASYVKRFWSVDQAIRVSWKQITLKYVISWKRIFRLHLFNLNLLSKTRPLIYREYAR